MDTTPLPQEPTEPQRPPTDNEVKKLKYEYLKSAVAVAASIVALITAMYSNYVSNENTEDIAHTASEVDQLKDVYHVAEDISGSFRILAPAPNEKIEEANFKVHGKWDGKVGTLQKNHIWLFAQQGNLYYPALGKVSVTANKEWSVDNMYLGITGRFDLLVILADTEDSAWIERWIRGTNGKALDGLPTDVIILNKVEIERV